MQWAVVFVKQRWLNLTEPVNHTMMNRSVEPVEFYTRYTINSGGDNITHVTRKYSMEGPVTTVSESSVTVYDRYGQSKEIGATTSTKEIYA